MYFLIFFFEIFFKIELMLEKGEDKFQEALQLTEEKIQLSNQSYETVDKIIRVLDNDLAKFANLLKEEEEKKAILLDHTQSAHLLSDIPEFPTQKPPKKRRSSNQIFVESGTFGGDRKQRRMSKHGSVLKPLLKQQVGTTVHPFKGKIEPDMPIDPNEPLYCVCRSVSHGNMIACEDPECEKEWFHFECVGLKETPKGRWFCPECTLKRKLLHKK